MRRRTSRRWRLGPRRCAHEAMATASQPSPGKRCARRSACWRPVSVSVVGCKESHLRQLSLEPVLDEGEVGREVVHARAPGVGGRAVSAPALPIAGRRSDRWRWRRLAVRQRARVRDGRRPCRSVCPDSLIQCGRSGPRAEFGSRAGLESRKGQRAGRHRQRRVRIGWACDRATRCLQVGG